MAPPLPPQSAEPQDPPEFINKGKILIMTRQYQEAVRVCRLGLLAHPTYVDGRLVLGMALMALARHDEVLAEMRVALELDPASTLAYLLKAEALLHKGDHEQALEMLDAALELEPQSEKARALMAQLEQAMGPQAGAGQRVNTETKVYPLQAVGLGLADDTSSGWLDDGPTGDARGGKSMQFVEGDEQLWTDEEEEPTGRGDDAPGPVPSLPAPQRDDGADEAASIVSADDEEYTTASFVEPLALNSGKPVRLMPGVSWKDDDDPDTVEELESPADLRAMTPPAAELDAGAGDLLDHLAEDTTTDAVPLGDDDDDDGMLAGEASVNTVVTGEVPSEEALFGDPPTGRDAWDSEPPPRQHHESTAALGTTSEPPSVAPVMRESSALEQQVEPDDYGAMGEGTHQLDSEELAEISEDEVETDAAMRGRVPNGPDLLQARDPFEAAAERGRGRDELEEEVSEISVEMLPDEEAMPPLPPDAGANSQYDVSAQGSPQQSWGVEERPYPPSPVEPAEPAFVPAREASGGDEDDDSATRVNFDALPDDSAPQLAHGAAAAEPEGPARGPIVYDPAQDNVQVDPALEPHLADDLGPLAPSRGPAAGAAGGAADYGYDDGYGQGYGQAQGHDFGAEQPPWSDQDSPEPPWISGEEQQPPWDEPQPEEAWTNERQHGGRARAQDGRGAAAGQFEVDDDELGLEPPDSGPSPAAWQLGRRPAPTALLDGDEQGGAAPAMPGPIMRAPTHETAPSGPKGLRGGRQPAPQGDGMLEQMTGGLGEAHAGGFGGRASPSDIIRSPVERHPERSVTSWLTVLVGEPGSRRWIYLLAGAVGVLALAVAVGLAVRYYRLGEQIEGRRSRALTRLRAGNLPDFLQAEQAYADILARRGDDQDARDLHAEIVHAIPVEFGVQVPGAARDGSLGDSPHAVAARVYRDLQQGNLDQAAARLLGEGRAHRESPALLYLAGRVALLEGNPEAAQRHLTEAHRKSPKDALVLNSLAEAQIRLGKVQRALETYQMALGVNRDHIESLLGRAELQIEHLWQPDRPVVALNSITLGKRKALAAPGQRAMANLLLARHYLHVGQAGQARDYMDKALQGYETRRAPFLDRLAALLIDAAYRLPEAEKIIARSKAAMKGRPQPFLQEARLHLLRGRPGRALSVLDEVKGAGVPQLKLLRAACLLQKGVRAEAKEAVEAVLDRSKEMPQALILEARVLSAMNAGGAGAKPLRDFVDNTLAAAVRRDPRNVELLTAQGLALGSLRRYAAARRAIEQALRVHKQYAPARFASARLLMGQGKLGKASRELDEAARTNAGNIRVMLQCAELELQMAHDATAVRVLREAARKAPKSALVQLALARALTLQRKYGEAEKVIREASASGASQDELNLARGRLALGRRKAATAVELLRKATAERSGDAEAWRLLVDAYRLDNKADEALKVAQSITESMQEHPQGRLALASVCLDKLKHDEATEWLGPLRKEQSQGLRSPRLAAEVLVLLGRAQQDAGHLSQADGLYTEAIKVCPRCPDPHYRLALVQDENGRSAAAIEGLKRAIKLAPDYIDPHFDLAQIYARAGKVSLAKQQFQVFMQKHPPPGLVRAAKEVMQDLEQPPDDGY